MKFASSIFKILFLSLCIVANVNLLHAQTAGILPNAKTTFVDQNGKPLTSGTVDFYEPGTSVRKLTYQDAEQTIPNANPVILDAAGRAQIWGNGSYRQVVKDRYLTLQWDKVTAGSGSSSGSSSSVGDGLQVGTVIPWSGLIAPVNYQFAYGQALSRSTYASLLTALTLSASITCVGGSPIITNIADTNNLAVGATLEALCVTGSPTIISKTASTVTLTSNATISTSTTGVFFIYGNGDGLTTFNVPDLRGVTLVGRCNMGGVNCSNLNSTYFSTNTNNTPSALNAIGGSQSHVLTLPEIPTGITSANASQNITVSLPSNQSAPVVTSTTVLQVQVANTGAGSFWVPYIPGSGWGQQNVSSGSNSISVTSNNTSGTAHSIVQPSKTVNYIIKTNPDSLIGIASISQLTGGLPNKLVGTDASGVFNNVNLPSGLTLSTLNLNFLAQACAGSTWAKSIDISGVWTCSQPNFTDLAGSIAVGQIPNNLVTNAKLAQAGAATIKGNPTNSTANVTDFTIQGLAARGAPDAANDKIPLYDNAAGTIKYVTPAQVASAGASGVSSLNGLTGGLVVGLASPNGRLTPSSGVCAPTTDVVAATVIYYAPCGGEYVPTYDGTNIQGRKFTSGPTDAVGLTLTLGSNWAATTLYDTFFTLNAGSPVLCTVAWSTSVAGTSTRATALSQYGLSTNSTLATCRINNTTTISMAANQGTYVGTFLTNSSAGQVDFKFGTSAAGGGAAVAGIWNMYNRTPGSFYVNDTTGNFGTSVTSTYQPMDVGGTGSGLNNRITFVTGTGTDPIDGAITLGGQPASGTMEYGLGLNVTNAINTRCGSGLTGNTAAGIMATIPCRVYAPIGLNFMQGIQWSTNNASPFISGKYGAITAIWWW
jgi:microcystin-dependent protein